MVHVYNDIIKHSPLQCLVLRGFNVDREADTDLELVIINGMDMITFPQRRPAIRLPVSLSDFPSPNIRPLR